MPSITVVSLIDILAILLIFFIVTTTFKDPSQRAKAFGVWGATAGVSIAVGPIVGGELITHFWYGSIFLVNVPLCLIAIAAIALVVPESKSPKVFTERPFKCKVKGMSG